jgi:2-polyprenyl-3-methyl-5-hydroxy-6-metoxy-1,4-benzoquinol methylase
MQRSVQTELLEGDGIPEAQVARAYHQLTRIHRYLGDTRAIVAAIREDPLPVRRVLDIGCAHGGVLKEVQRRLGVEAIGVDVKLPPVPHASPLIVAADGISDRLPTADVAFCMYLGHHLCERDLRRIIRNVGRSCRRFLLLDLIRHRLPLTVFKMFMAPLLCPIVATDGQRSIRRSYTPAELIRIAREALAGTRARFRHSTSPLYIRQILDITYHA